MYEVLLLDNAKMKYTSEIRGICTYTIDAKQITVHIHAYTAQCAVFFTNCQNAFFISLQSNLDNSAAVNSTHPCAEHRLVHKRRCI